MSQHIPSTIIIQALIETRKLGIDATNVYISICSIGGDEVENWFPERDSPTHWRNSRTNEATLARGRAKQRAKRAIQEENTFSSWRGCLIVKGEAFGMGVAIFPKSPSYGGGDKELSQEIVDRALIRYLKRGKGLPCRTRVIVRRGELWENIII